MREAVTILETGRLILREFCPSDIGPLAEILSDAQTMCFYPAPFDHAEVQDWIERNCQRYRKDGFGLWAMVLKSSGEMVGDCGLVQQEVDGEELVEIGYHVRRDLWGNGLATEAAQASRDLGFSKSGIERLISLIRPENQPSRRVAEKTGMTVEKETMWR